MKRVLSVLMICALMCCLFAGCNNEDPTPSTNPSTPSTPSVPTTGTPDVSVPATGVSVVALGVMALVSLAGAVITKKH